MTLRVSKAMLPAALILGALLLAALLIGSRPENKLQPAAPRQALVEVAEVHLQDLRIPIHAQGTVTPLRDTTLVSEVKGRIIQVSPAFHAGGFIAAGDMLTRIDDSDYRVEVMRARSAVAAARSNLAQEKGRSEVARREWEQLPDRGRRTQEARDLYLRKPQLEQANAQLLSAEAELQKAQYDLDRTVIRAPYDAVIREKQSDLGRFVSSGTAVARVFAVDYAEVRLALPQGKLTYTDLPGVGGYAANPPPVDLYNDVAGDVTHWPAYLHRTEASLDERSRVLFAVARIRDPYALYSATHPPLRIGTFVKANILSRKMSGIVPLPRHVLRAGNQVWIVDRDLRLRNRGVTTLRTEGDEIYVTSGLRDGDLVALTPIQDALPGMPVIVTGKVSTLREPGEDGMGIEAAEAEPRPGDRTEQGAVADEPDAGAPAK